MSDRLEDIFNRQRELQVKSYGHDPVLMTQKRKIQFIKDMSLALEDEVHEALGEVGWKPWATSDHIDRDAYVGELVDALHFFVNLCLVVDVTPAELHMRYFKKAKRNAERQEEGYDGITGKCPVCHRALDDPGVTCTSDRCAYGYASEA